MQKSTLWRSMTLLGILALTLVLSAAWSGVTHADQHDEKSESAPTLTRAMRALLENSDNTVQNRPPERLSATPCVDGMAGIYPCNNVDLLALLPLADMGGGGGNDIWGWTDPLDGKEYALMGRTSGTSFVDISDPENPVYLGNLPTHTGSTTWRDIKVYANYAFVVSEASGHGMQIFDLTRLRNVTNPPVTFTNDAHYNGWSNAHNVVINEDSGYAYGVGTNTCSGGLHMVDISNPLSPTNAGCFSSDGYTHDAQCVNYSGPDADYAGQEICFNSNEDTLTIADVTNKAAPVQISRNPYVGDGYTHQGWLTEDQTYFILSDELDEISFGHNTRSRIWDVSDLDAPVLIGSYDAPVSSVDHNLYNLGGYSYQSNYSSGLRILDLADIANGNLSEAAYFDTYPANDAANFDGTWSNYPFFESGIVIVSGRSEGLFILQPTLAPDYALSVSDTSLDVCSVGDAMTAIDVDARNGYTGSVTLGTTGLPGGASDSFSVNPVTVPGSSELTVTVSGTSAGKYPFDLTATDGAIDKSAELMLNVFAGTPGAAGLLSPANGATDVSTTPTLEWEDLAEASAYDVAIGTSPNILASLVDSALELSDTSWTPSVVLEPNTTYYWAMRTRNICGIGAVSAVYSFTTRDVPQVLLVDDDDNSPDVRASYETALAAAGLDYDLWDTGNSDNEPDAATMSQYELIVWFTGDEFGGAAGPSGSSENELATYLSSTGGCLLLSSQDYLWDRGGSGSDNPTPFMTDYLGMANGDSDVSQTTVTGQLPPVAGTYSLSYPFTNYSDELNPTASGNVLFTGNQGNAALYKLDAGWATTWWGFPLEALPTAQQGDFVGTVYNGCQAYTLYGIDLFAGIK